jgi:hypothetical protein
MDLTYSKSSKKSKSLCVKQTWGNLSALYSAYENSSGYAGLSFSINSSFDIQMEVYFNDFLEKTEAQNTTQDQLKYTFNIPANTPFYRNVPVRGERVRFKFTPDNNTPATTDTLLCVAILTTNTNFIVA